ncbi:hypothetical protein VTO42DRAFT_5137 [Malbranchea cinnamomea]
MVFTIDRDTISGIATLLLSGNWIAITVTAVVVFGLPMLLHYLLYRAPAVARSSDFLLLGPSGAGKTAFCSLLEQKASGASKPPHQTHTSQTGNFVTAIVPPGIKTKSDRYRSVNDPTLSAPTFRIRDTPGHGKLRSAQGIALVSSMSDVKKPKANARGIIFMLDAATLSESDGLRDAAVYLHDVLLILQQRVYKGGSFVTKRVPSIPVLVAANKQDLFTALPAEAVKVKLEEEIERHRQSKRRGLLDASENPTGDEEPEILGGDEGRRPFSFAMLQEEVGVSVDVIGGAVRTDEGADPSAGVRAWEEWIASCL